MDTHVHVCDRLVIREDEDHARESRPDDGPQVDRVTVSAQVEWSRLKFSVDHLADDRDAVGPVVGYCCDAEYGCNGGVRPECDQVDENAGDGYEPD
jgi:hypothetical protein